MFSVGEYIIYGVEGVCEVEEAGKLKVAGLDKNREYYRLRPYYHGGTIYTPVDGKAVHAAGPDARGARRASSAPAGAEAAGRCARRQPRRRASITARSSRSMTASASCGCAGRSTTSSRPSPPAAAPSAPRSCAAGRWPRRCSTGEFWLRARHAAVEGEGVSAGKAGQLTGLCKKKRAVLWTARFFCGHHSTPVTS